MIDEAYENYNNYMSENFMETRWCKVEMSPDGKSITGRKCNRNEFIIESKTQPGFSETWGLKIEERELSLEERYGLIETDKHIKFLTWQSHGTDRIKELLDEQSVPTRLITITYNNETIEVYE